MRIPKRAKQTLLLGPLLLLCGCGPEDRGSTAAEPGPSAASAPADAEPAAKSVPGGPVDPARDEAELIRLEHQYARALMTRDRAFLMRFYASDWRGGNWMGFWSKATMIKSILNARYVVKSMNVRDLKVRVMGDVAIVQGVDEEVTSLDGKDTSGKWAFTDIFARRDGQWVAVASHTSEVKPTGE
jgi:ketosteroid isomerase-like protein